jgi:hypothetical protein
VGVGAVFNHLYIVLPRNAEDFVHVSEAHAEMDGQNGFGFWRDRTLDQLCVETIRVGIDIYKNWNPAE